MIDLDSANGTLVNDETVPASRFYELRSGDGARECIASCKKGAELTKPQARAFTVLKFAFSTREYVLLVES